MQKLTKNMTMSVTPFIRGRTIRRQKSTANTHSTKFSTK